MIAGASGLRETPPAGKTRLRKVTGFRLLYAESVQHSVPHRGKLRIQCCAILSSRTMAEELGPLFGLTPEMRRVPE